MRVCCVGFLEAGKIIRYLMGKVILVRRLIVSFDKGVERRVGGRTVGRYFYLYKIFF